MKKILLAIIAASSIFASSAFAISAPQTHDGFFLNLSLGLGYQGFEYDHAHSSRGLESNGIATGFYIKLGGRVANNLLLHASLIGETNQSSLKETYNGEVEETYNALHDNLSILGVGLTYYFLQNIFVTASIGISQFNLQGDTGDDIITLGRSENGFAFHVGVGKEWWVSENWGLGISLNFTHGSADDQHDAGEMSGNGISVMFSATYN